MIRLRMVGVVVVELRMIGVVVVGGRVRVVVGVDGVMEVNGMVGVYGEMVTLLEGGQSLMEGSGAKLGTERLVGQQEAVGWHRPVHRQGGVVKRGDWVVQGGDGVVQGGDGVVQGGNGVVNTQTERKTKLK